MLLLGVKRLVDDPDEVHKWRTGRNVIKTFERVGTQRLLVATCPDGDVASY